MAFEDTWGISFDRAATELDESLSVRVAGHVACCIGLGATMYVADGHERAVRERIVDVWELYRAAVGNDVLVWGADPKTQKAKLLQKSPAILDVRTWMPRVGSASQLEAHFQGGVKKDDASSYRFSGFGGDADDPDPGCVSFTVPLSWAAHHPAGAYVALVLDAARRLRPLHGYAGLSVVPSLMENGTGDDMTYAVPLVKRFKGLDLDFDVLQTRFLGEHVKCAGWLTILDDSFVQRLGGRLSLSDKLGPSIVIHDYEGGLILQAGAQPRFGDTNRNEPMTDYEIVGRAIKSIRAQEMRSVAPWHGLDKDETARWLARFDG